jgi:hypothetical protein
MEDVCDRLLSAIGERDRDAARLLHPCLHRSSARGERLRGRTKVPALLQASPELRAPASFELFDRQIDRRQAAQPPLEPRGARRA